MGALTETLSQATSTFFPGLAVSLATALWLRHSAVTTHHGHGSEVGIFPIYLCGQEEKSVEERIPEELIPKLDALISFQLTPA